jgi:hypothetical protein
MNALGFVPNFARLPFRPPCDDSTDSGEDSGIAAYPKALGVPARLKSTARRFLPRERGGGGSPIATRPIRTDESARATGTATVEAGAYAKAR